MIGFLRLTKVPLCECQGAGDAQMREGYFWLRALRLSGLWMSRRETCAGRGAGTDCRRNGREVRVLGMRRGHGGVKRGCLGHGE